MPDYSKYKDYETKNIENLAEIKNQKPRPTGASFTTQDLPEIAREREIEREMRRQNRINRRQVPPKKDSRSTLLLVYIALLVVAIAVCVTVFVFAFRWVVNNPPEGIVVPDAGPIIAEPGNGAATAGREITEMVGLIVAISSNPRGLTLLDLETEQTREMPFDDEIIFRNRINNPIAFTQLRVGQVMEISYDEDSLEITVVRESADAWEHMAQTNVHVNLDNRTISIPHEPPFTFTSQTLVLHNNEPFPIGQIGPMDSITIVGLGTTAWLIQLDAAHGFFEIENFDAIENGVITIGNLHPLPIDEIVEPITLSDGTHRVVVDGDNIEPFIENIVIVQGQTFILDLSEVQQRMSVLHVVISPADARIFINDEDMQSPVSIVFGTHTIRVEHEDYFTEERTITITERVMSERFALEPIPRIPEPNLALVAIRSQPSNASVYINGVFTGTTDGDFTVPSGIHAITIRLPGFYDNTFHITVSEGDEIDRIVIMQQTNP